MKIKTLVFFMTALFAVNFQIMAQESAPESAQSLLEKAQVKAMQDGKFIFVKFEASWCGWCHRMTKNMKAESTKSFFEDNFITLPLVVFETKNNKNLENSGAEDLIKKFNNGESKVGLPFWFILDKDLNLITDSYDANKQNLGCPASEAEVVEFIKKLKHIIADFSETDAAMITKQFVLKR